MPKTVKKKKPKVVAVCCSDIHLSHKAPVARSVEPDWYAAMERTLSQVAKICDTYEAPLIVAGDIFDKWNNHSKLVNFAINQFSRFPNYVYTIPGQHDLPYHDYDKMIEGSYWTLQQATDAVIDLEVGLQYIHNTLSIYGYPWERYDFDDTIDDEFAIAVVHKYIYKDNKTSYPGAKKSARVLQHQRELKEYRVSVFGDNHIPFESTRAGHTTINCGSLIARKLDEINHRPSVGLIRDDGSVVREYLDTSDDKFIDPGIVLELLDVSADHMEEFVSSLSSTGSQSINFVSAIRDWLKHHDVGTKVSNYLRSILDEVEDE